MGGKELTRSTRISITLSSNPPSIPRLRSIAKMAQALGIKDPVEEDLANDLEARNLQYDLRNQLRAKKRR